MRRGRVLLRRHGPAAPIWRRAAVLGGAVAIGLVAVLFAAVADRACELFDRVARSAWWLPLILTPTVYAAVAWATRFAPAATGSGIRQVMAARRHPKTALNFLTSARTATSRLH